jgi:hypothetical protein
MSASQETPTPAIVAPQVLLGNHLIEAHFSRATMRRSPWNRHRTAPITRAICCACANWNASIASAATWNGAFGGDSVVGIECCGGAPRRKCAKRSLLVKGHSVSRSVVACRWLFVDGRLTEKFQVDDQASGTEKYRY